MQCNHGWNLTEIKIYFLEHFASKIHNKCHEMVLHVLKHYLKLELKLFIFVEVQYFVLKLLRGYIVACMQCNHGWNLTEIKIYFLEHFASKIHNKCHEMVLHVLKHYLKLELKLFIFVEVQYFVLKLLRGYIVA